MEMQTMDDHSGALARSMHNSFTMGRKFFMFLFGTVKWQLVFLLHQNYIVLAYINWVTASISRFQCSKMFSAITEKMHLDIPSGVVSAPSCSNSSLAVVTYCI
jgi:hypothetical protein